MNRKALSTLIVVSFVLLIISVMFLVSRTHEARKLDPVELESMTKDQILQTVYTRQAQTTLPTYYFLPVFAFFGIGVGALALYINQGELDRKSKMIKVNSKLILALLDREEKRVVEKLVELGGRAQQLEITYLEGFSKVKAHRTVLSLESKGIATKEKMGKARMIKLNTELYDMLRGGTHEE